jgi:hypothetical protein
MKMLGREHARLGVSSSMLYSFCNALLRGICWCVEEHPHRIKIMLSWSSALKYLLNLMTETAYDFHRSTSKSPKNTSAIDDLQLVATEGGGQALVESRSRSYSVNSSAKRSNKVEWEMQTQFNPHIPSVDSGDTMKMPRMLSTKLRTISKSKIILDADEVSAIHAIASLDEDLESPGSLPDLPSLPELPEGPSSRSQAVSCSDVGSLNFVPATVIDLDEK